MTLNTLFLPRRFCTIRRTARPEVALPVHVDDGAVGADVVVWRDCPGRLGKDGGSIWWGVSWIGFRERGRRERKRLGLRTFGGRVEGDYVEGVCVLGVRVLGGCVLRVQVLGCHFFRQFRALSGLVK
jgi:hypothetical protein